MHQISLFTSNRYHCPIFMLFITLLPLFCNFKNYFLNWSYFLSGRDFLATCIRRTNLLCLKPFEILIFHCAD